MNTKHKVIFGNSMSMEELLDESVHLILTSPPYFNAPFDYKDLFKNYEQYLAVIKKMANLDPFPGSGTTMKVARWFNKIKASQIKIS